MHQERMRNVEVIGEGGSSLLKKMGNNSRCRTSPADPENFLKSLSELFADEDEGDLELFGDSRNEDLSLSSSVDGDEVLRTKQKAIKKANEKWHGSCQSFSPDDDLVINFNASVNELWASFNDLLKKGQGQNNSTNSPVKLSNKMLKSKFQRLKAIRRELMEANGSDPLLVHGKTSNGFQRSRPKQNHRSEKSPNARVSGEGEKQAKEDSASSSQNQRESLSQNISVVPMTPCRGAGLSMSISDITMSPFSGSSPKETIHQAGRQRSAAVPDANKCDQVLLHGTQRALGGPMHLTKQQSCDFSPRKPTRIWNEDLSSRFDEMKSIDPLFLDEDIHDASHEEAVVVCPSPRRKTAIDSCPLESGFDDRLSRFRRSLSTPIITSTNASAPPKRPSRAQSPTGAKEQSAHSRSKSSEAVLPSPVTPREEMVCNTVAKAVDPEKLPKPILLPLVETKGSAEPLSLAKRGRSKSKGMLADSKASTPASRHSESDKLRSPRKLKDSQSTSIRSVYGKLCTQESSQRKSMSNVNGQQKSRRLMQEARAEPSQPSTLDRRSTRRLLDSPRSEHGPGKDVSTQKRRSRSRAPQVARQPSSGVDNAESKNSSENSDKRRPSNSPKRMSRVQRIVSLMNHNKTPDGYVRREDSSDKQSNEAESSALHATQRDNSALPSLLKSKINIGEEIKPSKDDRSAIAPVRSEDDLNSYTAPAMLQGRKEIVVPAIVDFKRMPSEGAMSTHSGSSRDIAPVTPRRFRRAFTTSNSCKGFNAKCDEEDHGAKTMDEDIVLPGLAAANDARDYSGVKSPYLSPRKISKLLMKQSQSCRHFVVSDDSKDTAPVSPRRTTCRHLNRSVQSRKQAVTDASLSLRGIVASGLAKQAESCRTLRTSGM